MEHIGFYLGDIYFNRKSGLLSFDFEPVQKYFLFADGSLVFARTNQAEERIGEILVERGKLSRKLQLKLDDYIVPGKEIGKVLIEHGLITEKDLYEGLRHQIKRIIFNIFPLFQGTFSFKEGSEYVKQKLGTRIEIPPLIEDGIRGMPFDPCLSDFFSRKIPIFSRNELLTQLTDQERKIYNQIDGNSTADSLFYSSGFEKELYWKSIYLFYCLGLIDLKNDKESSEKEKKEREGLPDSHQSNVEEALDFFNKTGDMNYYQILNVTQMAPHSEVKNAYFKLARKFHPDLFEMNLQPEKKEKIVSLFDRIAKAYRTLSSEQSKNKYDLSINIIRKGERTDNIKTAETKYRQAKSLYDRGKYDDARILLKEALSIKSEVGKYHLLLALAESKNPEFHKNAEENFIKAKELDPWNAEAYVGLGLLYKKAGLMVKAARQFKSALDVNPDHPVALKELDISRKPEKKSSLKKIFSFIFFGRNN